MRLLRYIACEIKTQSLSLKVHTDACFLLEISLQTQLVVRELTN